MKKMIFLLLLPVALFAQINVTFRVNMGLQMRKGLFSSGKDSVAIRGDFQTLAGKDSLNWIGFSFKLKPVNNNDSIYSGTIIMPDVLIGKVYHYKFMKNSGGLENGPDRIFALTSGNMILPIACFNNDSVMSQNNLMVTDSITFFADIRDIWGSGDGYFDESRDSLLIDGLTDANFISGNRRFELINPTSTGVYKTTLVIRGFAGDTLHFKYQTFPTCRYVNNGFETYSGRTLPMSFTDSTITLPFIQPSFKPQIILTKDVEVHFSLEFLSCATNALNNRPIPIKQIKWVGIKGSSPVLGGWGGNWTEADTLVDPATGYPTMLKMNDSGVDGDETAGDGRWTKKVIFPVGSIGGLIEFKFGCVYQGADTANGGKFPLNNEMPGELNHQFMLVARIDGNPIQISEYFGPTSDCQSGVDDRDLHPLSRAKNYSLEQNYPNPFNPTTKIKFSLLHDEFVTLKIYNIAGNEIAALVKQQLKEGTYETTFDADKLSTGVYFYRLTAGEFSVAKKMIFMK